MGKAAVDVARLSREQQLERLDELWEALAALPLTDEQRRDLDNRLDSLEAEGPTGLTWDETLARVRSPR